MFGWLLNIHKCFGHKRQKSEDREPAPAADQETVPVANVESVPEEAGRHEYGIQLYDGGRHDSCEAAARHAWSEHSGITLNFASYAYFLVHHTLQMVWYTYACHLTNWKLCSHG